MRLKTTFIIAIATTNSTTSPKEESSNFTLSGLPPLLFVLSIHPPFFLHYVETNQYYSFFLISVKCSTMYKNAMVSDMESNSFEKIEYSEQAQEFKKRYIELVGKDPIAVSKKIFTFVHGILLENHTEDELHDYEAYCIVIGSTPHKQPERFDLEGDESIVQFVEHLAEGTEEPKEE